MIETVVWIIASVVAVLVLIIIGISIEFDTFKEIMKSIKDENNTLKKQVKCLNYFLKIEDSRNGKNNEELMIMALQEQIYGTCYKKSLVLDYLLKDAEFVEEKIEPEKKISAHFKKKEPEFRKLVNGSWIELTPSEFDDLLNCKNVKVEKGESRKTKTTKTNKKGKGKK